MSNNRRVCHDPFNKNREEYQAALGIRIVGNDKHVNSNYILVVKLGYFHVISTFFTKYCFHNFKKYKMTISKPLTPLYRHCCI